jgi:hypothetical protein
MKKSSLFFLLICFACEVDENTPTKPVNDPFDESTATIIKQGMLAGAGGHTASGTASIYESNGKYVVTLDPYSSQNGPDLKVYLSKNVSASSYLNLGQLKSTTGKQTYSVPGNPNMNEYTYVHVWCEQFSVEFARAEMK